MILTGFTKVFTSLGKGASKRRKQDETGGGGGGLNIRCKQLHPMIHILYLVDMFVG